MRLWEAEVEAGVVSACLSAALVRLPSRTVSCDYGQLLRRVPPEPMTYAQLGVGRLPRCGSALRPRLVEPITLADHGC